jgi:hypothetical protein
VSTGTEGTEDAVADATELVLTVTEVEVEEVIDLEDDGNEHDGSLA